MPLSESDTTPATAPRGPSARLWIGPGQRPNRWSPRARVSRLRHASQLCAGSKFPYGNRSLPALPRGCCTPSRPAGLLCQLTAWQSEIDTGWPSSRSSPRAPSEAPGEALSGDVMARRSSLGPGCSRRRPARQVRFRSLKVRIRMRCYAPIVLAAQAWRSVIRAV